MTTPFQSKTIQKRCQKTLKKKYGVNNAWQSPNARKGWEKPQTLVKIFKTFKKNFSYNSSKPEEKINNILSKLFLSVDRQHVINGWAIDFYVKDINIYVQVDGIYWHGLDRPIEEIKKFRSKRDTVIYKKYLTDQKQNKWFSQQNKRLIRITDHQIKILSDDELVFIINGFKHQTT